MLRPIALFSVGLVAATLSACSTNDTSLDTQFLVRPLESASALSEGEGMLSIKSTVTSTTPLPLRLRLNGKYAVIALSDTDFAYYETTPQPIEGGYLEWLGMGTAFPTGSVVAELVDRSGNVVATSTAGTVSPSSDFEHALYDATSVVFVGTLDHVSSRTINPFPRDNDPTTDQITVMNVIDREVTVETCEKSVASTQCSLVGTLQPGAELSLTASIFAAPPATSDPNVKDHILRVRPSDATSDFANGRLLYYDRILNTEFAGCQVEELFALGSQKTLTADTHEPAGLTGFGETSCIR